MNRPPLPTTLSAKRTRRPEENLTSRGSGLRGAVLLPVIPQSQSWILVKRTDVSGEGGKNFNLHCFLLEVLHPPHGPNRGKQMELVNRDARKHRKIKHQNGRERPHFSGFNPPKKFAGSLPPVLLLQFAHAEIFSPTGPAGQLCIHECSAEPCTDLHSRV